MKDKQKHKRNWNLVLVRLMSILLALVSLLSIAAFPAEAATYYKKGVSYYTYNKYVVNLRENGGDKLIHQIPAGEWLYVYEEYTLDPDRVCVQHQGKDGNVLKGGCLRQYLPHYRNYYKAVTGYNVNLRDNEGDFIIQIPAGEEVEVLGVSTKDASRSVVRWKKTYYGDVLNGGLKKVTSNTPTPTTPTTPTTGISSFKFKVKEEYDAIVHTYALALLDANGRNIGVVPVGEKVRVHGILAGDPRRAIITYEGKEGSVKLKWLCRVSEPYNKPEGFKYDPKGYGYWAMVGKYDLQIWDKNQNKMETDVAAYSIVWVYGSYEESTGYSRVVVNHYGRIGTIRDEWLEKAGQGDAMDYVDIDHQRVSVIKNGVLIAQGPCQSGLKGVYDTEPGEYRVAYKQNPAYFSRWDLTVNYCVSFDGDVCFHTSPASEFEANSYITDGSHGCVRLIEWLAKIVYSNSHGPTNNRAGTAVYVASLYYNN